MKYPLKHFVICIGKDCNRADRGVERGECIQAELKAHNKSIGRKSIARVCTVSCLDLCDHGPNMIAYPGGTVYSHLTRETALAAYQGEMGDGPKRPDLELELPPKSESPGES
jgi:(2Fe-2S) ferredoxin